MKRVGVWVPFGNSTRSPAETPLSARAPRLAERGVEVLFGEPHPEGFAGLLSTGASWRPWIGPVDAVYDRFPAVTRPDAYLGGLTYLAGTPVGNSPALAQLCTDKVACQRVLEAAGVPCPPMAVTDLSRAVEAWGSAFVKPQFGSFGNGVRKVRPHDPLPESGAWLVQRAIPSPPGWAGIAIRALVQREPEGRWVVAPLVVRRSRHDPVVNAARGAEVVPSDDLPGPTLDMARDLAERAARALADRAALALEFGVDLAVDPDMTPWIVEVNGKPRGRLGVLAARWPERFTEAWNQVLDRPLLTLASFSGPIDSEPT